MLSWKIQEAENTDTGKWIVCCNLINAYLNLMLKKAYKRTKQLKEKLNFSIVRVCVYVWVKREKKERESLSVNYRFGISEDKNRDS